MLPKSGERPEPSIVAKLILGNRLNTSNSMFLLRDRVRRRGERVSTRRRIKLLIRLGRTPLQTLAQCIRCSVWKARRPGCLNMEAGAEVGRRALIQRVQCSWNCAGGGAAPTSG